MEPCIERSDADRLMGRGWRRHHHGVEPSGVQHRAKVAVLPGVSRTGAPPTQLCRFACEGGIEIRNGCQLALGTLGERPRAKPADSPGTDQSNA
jgi:hypothetical protein